jgi:hypothetical protein
MKKKLDPRSRFRRAIRNKPLNMKKESKKKDT